MSILLTRPHIDNLFMEKKFRDYKIKTLSAPLLTISYNLPLDLDYQPYQGAIITSQHSLPSLQKVPRDLPLFIVGDATTNKAKELGFLNIYNAHGDSSDLACLIKEKCPDKLQPILYPAGKFIKQTIREHLKAYTIHIYSVYEALPVIEWPEDILDNIRNGHIKWICLFSDRSAQTLLEILRENNLQKYMRTISLCSFSPSITRIAENLYWKKIVTCPYPNMMSFWEIVEKEIFGYNGKNMQTVRKIK